ncbi:MAG TPA: plastocyanin/azurin family copper-binding protein [Nitrososphaeraceae archaeon]|nr:plastocyanin/azurin family copper-binding protein [Nitrososphaeraceae archaeon]
MSIKSILAVVAVISALSITLLITTANFKVISAQNTTTTTATTKVQAGGGNSTAPLTAFVPQNIEIKAGESVTWDNPSTVGEPHTATFVLDNKTTTGIVSPFGVPNSTQFAAIPPNSNNEPLKVPGQNNVVIAVNARSFIPTVIDSQGTVKQFAPPNAAYTMNGSEKYVNSGWLVPKGQEQLYPGSSTSFTVTFQKAGTYHYICQLHPWMVGSVLVK